MTARGIVTNWNIELWLVMFSALRRLFKARNWIFSRFVSWNLMDVLLQIPPMKCGTHLIRKWSQKSLCHVCVSVAGAYLATKHRSSLSLFSLLNFKVFCFRVNSIKNNNNNNKQFLFKFNKNMKRAADSVGIRLPWDVYWQRRGEIILLYRNFIKIGL